MTDRRPTERAMPRNIAVDFFRGLGLWIVYVDHIDQNTWSRFMLWRFGFSDFAEIFIFLSGFIGIASYERSLAAGNFTAALKTLGRRLARLYVAHIVSMTLSLLLLGFFAQRGLRWEQPGLYDWMQAPAHYLLAALMLTYAPHIFALLPLYIVLCPMLLLAAIGLRRAPKATLSISGALWLATQFPAFDTHIPTSFWYFHPLAWQFLFVLGAATRYYSGRLGAFARSRPIVWIAGTIVAVSVVLKIFTASLNQHLFGILQRNAGKPSLESYRLVHFLALLALVYLFTYHHRQWLKSIAARVAIACGVDALVVYSSSLVLATGANLILSRTHGGPIQQLELTLSGLAILCAIAWLRQTRKLRAKLSRTLVSQQHRVGRGSILAPIRSEAIFSESRPRTQAAD